MPASGTTDPVVSYFDDLHSNPAEVKPASPGSGALPCCSPMLVNVLFALCTCCMKELQRQLSFVTLRHARGGETSCRSQNTS